MRYLVTGGAGFIGSHVVDALVENGHDVVVLDNLSSGHRKNLAQVKDKIIFIEGDIRDPEVCLMASRNCNGIFHEAALASVADSIERPRENHEINITGTLNVFEAARTNGVKRVVVASSAAVYGNSPELPKHEEMKPEPKSPYAVAKIACEYYLRIYAELHGLECVALRYFNVFGPRQNPSSPYSGVISIFSSRIQQGLPVTIFGDGEQTRDFVNIKDVVSANMLAMTNEELFGSWSPFQLEANDSSQGSAGFAVFNVAAGESHSLLQLLDTLETVAGKKVEHLFTGKRAGDILHSSARNAKLRAQGWAPSVGLAQGLEELLSKEISA